MAQVARASNSCLPSCGLTSEGPGRAPLDPPTTLLRDILSDMSVIVRASLEAASRRMDINASTCRPEHHQQEPVLTPVGRQLVVVGVYSRCLVPKLPVDIAGVRKEASDSAAASGLLSGMCG